MNDITQDLLITQMKRGNQHAFEQIYKQYRPSVFRTACLISGNSQDGEDITQETFIKVFTHCRELKSNAMFRYWLFRILNRTAWQLLNRKKSEIPDETVLDKAETDTNLLTEDILLKREAQNEIYQAVMQLDYNLRLVVILYYYNELSTKQIAKIAECCEGTIKSRLFTARKQLRQLIPEERYDDYRQGNYHEKQSI